MFFANAIYSLGKHRVSILSTLFGVVLLWGFIGWARKQARPCCLSLLAEEDDGLVPFLGKTASACGSGFKTLETCCCFASCPPNGQCGL